MKKILFINAGSRRARNSRELEKLLEACRKQADLEVHVIRKGREVAPLLRAALQQGVSAVGAAGGDGTINLVASFLVNTGVPLVVISFGTLNHFARDIGAPGKVEEALALFEDGSPELKIDVGEVNGAYFLNNSSIGLYPRLVKHRERYEKRLGKGLAYLLAGWDVLRHPDLLKIKLAINGEVQSLKVGLVFFSNNRAEMSPLQAGRRARLSEQVLDTYLVKATTPLELIRVAASFLRNKLDQSPLVSQAEVCEATIYSARRRLRVAFDGEAMYLTPPLQYRIHSQALLVRVPASQLEDGQPTDQTQPAASQ